MDDMIRITVSIMGAWWREFTWESLGIYQTLGDPIQVNIRCDSPKNDHKFWNSEYKKRKNTEIRDIQLQGPYV